VGGTSQAGSIHLSVRIAILMDGLIVYLFVLYLKTLSQ
jgi:hypothetical protein